MEKAPNSSKEREMELMKETEELKKRLREIEVPFEERKLFQSGYARNQQDKTNCFSCGRIGHIARNRRSKADGNRSLLKEEIFLKQKVGKRNPGLDDGESSSRGVNSPIKIENIKAVTYGLDLNPEGIIRMSVKGPGLKKEVGEQFMSFLVKDFN